VWRDPALATLLPEAAELEPPPIIWKAMETNDPTLPQRNVET
jgi:hypothetical protein